MPRWLVVMALLVGCARGAAAQPAPPPDWLARGFVAAWFDPSPGAAMTATSFAAFGRALEGLAAAGRGGPVLAQAIRYLASNDPETRWAGGDVLGKVPLEQADAASLDALLALFGHGDAAVRAEVLQSVPGFPDATRNLAAAQQALSLALAGEADRQAVGFLRGALARESGSDVAALLLERARSGDPAAESLLLDVMKGWPPPSRLSDLQRDELEQHALRALDDDDRREAGAAILAHRVTRGGASLTARFLAARVGDLIANADPAVRQLGLRLARRLPDPLGEVDVAAILELTRRDDAALRESGAKALEFLPSARLVSELRGELQRLLADPEPRVRESALYGATGNVSVADGPDLMDMLFPLTGDGDSEARAKAFRAIAAIGRIAGPDSFYPAMNLLLERGRDSAGRALSEISWEAIGRLPSATTHLILPLLAAPDWDTRAKAASALALAVNEVDEAIVVAQLLPLLGDREMRVRWSAARALALRRPGTLGQDVLDAVFASLPDEDEQPRRWKAAIIGAAASGPRAPAAAARLRAMLADRDLGQRSFAADALSHMADGDRGDIDPDLVLPLLAEDPRTRTLLEAVRAAIRLLTRLPAGDRAAAIVTGPLMPTLLGRAGPNLTQPALEVAMRWGKLPPSAVPGLLATAATVEPSRPGRGRALAAIVTGADPDAMTLLAWIGHPATLPVATVEGSPHAAHEVLALFASQWDSIAAHPTLRREAATRIATIVVAACGSVPVTGCWAPHHHTALDLLRERLREEAPATATLLAVHLTDAAPR